MTNSEKQELLNKLYTEKMNLESNLNSTDYKVIKCAEYKAADIELPYDIDTLHAERQAMRDRINQIEDEIKGIEVAEPEEETVPEVVEE